MDQTYEIIDGVRRAKAVQLAGGQTIRARLYDGNTGALQGEFDVRIDFLRSPHKDVIARTRRADQTRWQRVVQGALQIPIPFPPIEIQEGTRGVRIENIVLGVGIGP